MMTEKPLLNLDLKLRNTTWADVKAVADLIYAVCEADGDVTVAMSAEELEHEWHKIASHRDYRAFEFPVAALNNCFNRMRRIQGYF